MRNRELRHIWVGVSSRQVVIRVIAQRKISGAHRLAQKTEMNPPRTEKILHQLISLRRRKLFPNQPGSRISKRSAHSFQRLVTNGVVYVDGQSARRASSESQRRLRTQQRRLIWIRLNHVDRLPNRGRQQEHGPGKWPEES